LTENAVDVVAQVAHAQVMMASVREHRPGECVVDRTIVDELMDRSRTADPLEELTARERTFWC
jgi:hypothetical protein